MKPCSCRKPGIDVAHHAGMRERHFGDDVVAEPVYAAPLGKLVDFVGVDARVDRSAHQHHRARHIGIVIRFHQRNGSHDRHRGLAHGNDVHVAIERVQYGYDVVDVGIEIEAPFRMRHHAGVDPFGDVDVVIGQECLDRAAQQRRIVARHRRDDQQLRLRAARRTRERALEMQQPAERTLPYALDGDRNLLGADGG